MTDKGFEKLLEHHIDQTRTEHARVWDAIIAINAKMDILLEYKGSQSGQTKWMTWILTALIGAGMSVFTTILLKGV